MAATSSPTPRAPGAAKAQQVDALATAHGLARYELSNWARPGCASRHNRTYWRDGDWLAFGAGAHGHWRGRRWWLLRSPERYVERALAGASSSCWGPRAAWAAPALGCQVMAYRIERQEIDGTYQLMSLKKPITLKTGEPDPKLFAPGRH